MSAPHPEQSGLIRILFRSRALFGASVLATLVAGGAATAVVAVINTLIAQPDASWASGTLFMSLCAVAMVAGFSAQYILIRQLEHGVHDLRLMLQQKLVAYPLKNLEKEGSARLLAVLTDDVKTVANSGPSLTVVWSNAAVVLVCVAYMIALSWKLALLVVPLSLVLFGMRVATLIADRSGRRAVAARDELFKHFRTLLEGAKELKMHRERRERWLVHAVTDASERYRDNIMATHRVYLVVDNILSLLSFLAMGFVLFLAAVLIDVERSVIIAFALTLLFVQSPIRQVANQLRVLAMARISLARIQGLDLVRLAERTEQAELPPLHDRCDVLELDGIVHRYESFEEEREFVLGPVSLKLEAGKVVFLVGPNGSGKSTLAKVLCGLYAPEQGRVVFNGEEIDDANRDWYRQHISAVFADFFLFDDLRLSQSATDIDERARYYLEKLKLAHKVEVKDGCVSTLALSSGQRRRMALLSAHLEDRPVCLFDEWAADQDPAFKELFYREFLPELRERGKAVLVISHDDRYFDAADELVKLDEGREVAAAGRSAAPRQGAALTG